jgi:puromycin-sensitive aminopeptidase
VDRLQLDGGVHAGPGVRYNERVTALDRDFRLSPDFVALELRPTLTLDLAAGTFEGELEIDGRLEGAGGLSELRLHALDLDVLAARVVASGGSAQDAHVDTDEASQTVGLLLAEPLPAGPLRLEVRWRGRFSGGLRGLYRAGPLAVTQFEAADARRVFPCLDEPCFKAVWRLRVRGIPQGLVVLSNGLAVGDVVGADGLRSIEFAGTPPIPSYLVALVVGELAASPTADVVGVPVRTWAVPDKVELTAFGQECVARSLPLLQDYFGCAYAFAKLDQVGVPDFEAGAMENAGCITYRETALLVADSAPLRARKLVAEVVTHELAHHWFGNLVTMQWWDDLWLNEAFATWIAYLVVDGWKPEWELWMDFEVGKQAALGLDALLTTHPIHSEIRNAEEAGETFDLITYEKGGAVLRMLEGYVGPTVFRQGIRDYIREFRHRNAKADDLWRSLGAAAGTDLVEVAHDWIDRAGFPLVTLELDPGRRRVTLTQERFISDPQARIDEEPRLVPVVLRFRDDAGDHRHAVLLRERVLDVELPGSGALAWCLANAGARGFYRTALGARAAAAALSAVSELDPVERLALVADAWATCRAGRQSIGDVLAVVERLETERHHSVLDEVCGLLATLEYRHVDSADLVAFRGFVLRCTEAAARDLGTTASAADDDGVRLARAAVLQARVLVARDPALVAWAAGAFDALLGGARPEDVGIDANLLDVVVAAGARATSAAGFAAMRARARDTVDPVARRRWLLALARCEDPALTDGAIDLGFGEEIPLQDVVGYLGVLLRNPATRDATWGRIRRQIDRLAGRVTAPMLRSRLVEALGALVTAPHLEELRELLAAHPLEGTSQAAAQTLERLRLEVALADRVRPALSAWLAVAAARG